ncbi:MAG: GntR family transcriptional regulator [Opitutaceae bacterium]|nr:GntR family transcriptional regulator [Opitutaceae bacterium]
MSSAPLTLTAPKRLPLAAQTAAVIRTALEKGSWKELVPSERRLAEMLRISRPTIRAALHLLAKEGLIEIRPGRRNRLLSRPKRRAASRSRLVVLVAHETVSHFTHPFYKDIGEMRAHLHEQGFTTEFLLCPPRGTLAQRRVEEFLRQNRVFCCALIAANKGLQQWFCEHAIPALVVGSCHAGVRLPSVEVDYRLVCRHAAGIFLHKGHRRLVLVIPNSSAAGDLASERGFLEAIEQGGHRLDARGTVLRHDGTAEDITSRLDVLFNSANAPTALLVAKIPHAFIVLIYLLKRGLAVPDSVSFIARDHDRIFEMVRPPVAHYTLEDGAFERRLSRLMLQLVNQGYLDPEPHLIFPKFFLGGTVRQFDSPSE